jgi:NTE family protein
MKSYRSQYGCANLCDHFLALFTYILSIIVSTTVERIISVNIQMDALTEKEGTTSITTLTNLRIIKTLCFAGGGFFGIAHVGALDKLNKHNALNKVVNLIGVSVGSIIATLFAIGYSPDEMKTLMIETDFDSLIKDNYFAYMKMYDSFGMYNAQLLEDEIETWIRNKTHIKNCTFNQISKHLTIIATNLNYQRPRLFNRDLTPDVPISKAIRMSISYPIVMTPVLFEGDYYGDGGEFINYPITLVDRLDETLGLTFASYGENDNGTLDKRIAINNIYDYLRSIGSTLCRASYVSQMNEQYLNHSIIIHIKENIDSMQFNLTLDQKQLIYQWGSEAVQEQIKKIIK